MFRQSAAPAGGRSLRNAARCGLITAWFNLPNVLRVDRNSPANAARKKHSAVRKVAGLGEYGVHPRSGGLLEFSAVAHGGSRLFRCGGATKHQPTAGARVFSPARC